MRTRRVLLALGLAVLTIGVLAPASPAGASAVSANDPFGDGHGSGDIRGIRVFQSGSNTVFQIRTERPLNIASAPAWTGAASATVLRFNIDSNGGGIDRVVRLTRGDSGPSVEYLGIASPPAPRRPCAVVSQPALTVIRVNLANSCLEGSTVRAFARYTLDVGGNGTQDSDDRAPNFGFTPAITLN